MIIKRLGNNPAAQRCQRAELDRHLKRQHADRQIYYLSRARSRLDASSSAPVTITCILDSMDQAKHSWPRSKAMQAKQFANFNRPRLIQTTMLCHGHGMVMVLSPHHVSANSSRSCEVIAAGLTLLERQRMVDMRQVTLSIQGDNSSKELKNMSCLRMLALKTALGHVKASEMSFLSSGHSHEDIDAFFAVARKWLEKSRELWVPEAFRESLQQFVDNPAVRPYEKFRKVVLMSQYRNWNLSFNIMMTSSGVTTIQPPTTPTPPPPPSNLHFRKLWLSTLMEHAQLKGIGGPGAPHVFRLERFEDAGHYYLFLIADS